MQFKPYGVKLDFTPTITPQGAINLKVAPEVSSLDFTNAVTLQGFTIPSLAQRRAETEVLLKDGESFAIAGLIDQQVIETMDKVPGLGDIPILGKLFRSRSTQKSNDELLVVITPHFVRPLSPEEKAKLPDMPAAFLPGGGRSEGQAVEEQGHDAARHPRQPAGVCRTPWPADTQAVADSRGLGRRTEATDSVSRPVGNAAPCPCNSRSSWCPCCLA